MGTRKSHPEDLEIDATTVSSFQYGVDKVKHPNIDKLFTDLKTLPPMDKYGEMSGRCEKQTTAMEKFLRKRFGFENIQNEYIVDGVRSFKLAQTPASLPKQEIIEFPKVRTDSFKMEPDEIVRWQKTYRVYASSSVPGMSNEFLQKALRGKSKDGEEAFRMKFVIRISTCPILMEFDGKIIPREISDKWIDNIKLVSVSGIDFAARKHDVDDIRNYITNWKDIFHYDTETDIPIPANGRDFVCKRNWAVPKLDENRIKRDLYRMAYLRLFACNAEKVQIAVETGIGLGVFAGRFIGIDDKIRIWSGQAVKYVLERHGKQFTHIEAVVFALPIFDQTRDVFHDFRDVFESSYKGPIPVMIADQDMHRLTVAIARRGFRVSELNPADSHGVFGEYWQNLGPAVEEKLALTTVGLLVQHHLFNQEVLNPDNYVMVDDSRFMQSSDSSGENTHGATNNQNGSVSDDRMSG